MLGPWLSRVSHFQAIGRDIQLASYSDQFG
jgi:hypothetical protein